MKKLIRTFILSILVLCFALSSYGCDGCQKEKDGDVNVIEDTSIVLFDGVSSDYIIVVPKEATNFELTAANELKNFFYQATGFNLVIEPDENLPFGEKEKYLSVGKTALLEKAGVEIVYSKLGFDGYVIKTINQSVFMCGGGDFGTQFSVYGFLRHNLGWECYADDEIVIPKAEKLNLKSFNYTDIPDFKTRYVTHGALVADQLYARRLGLSSEANYMVGGGHSFFFWLPKETYYSAHPDWYSTDGTQLCLSNDEMVEELTNRIKEELVINKDIRYVMIGQEDIYTWCDCERCAVEVEKYKAGGQNVRFLNKVSDIMSPWLEENMPDRKEKIYYIGYAYHRTESAPVKTENNEKVPIDDTVICRNNVMIDIAPIYAKMDYSITSGKNNSLKLLLEDWSKVCSNMYVYLYAYCALAGNVPIYNYNAFAGNYRAFKEMGFNTVFEQGMQRSDMPCMTELKSYVQAKLMWDTTLSVDDLVADFINHFYGPASTYIQQYFESQRNWLNYCLEYKRDKYVVSVMVFDPLNSELWPKHLVDSWDELLDEGIKALEPLKETNKEAYEKYYWRIQQERVSTLYMNIEFNSSYYTREEYIGLIDTYEFLTNKFKYVNNTESYSNTEYISDKRSELK